MNENRTEICKLGGNLYALHGALMLFPQAIQVRHRVEGSRDPAREEDEVPGPCNSVRKVNSRISTPAGTRQSDVATCQ
jgi:hypothetical protein